MECTENRKLEQHNVPDKLPEEALEILKKASKERDLEDFRDVSGPHWLSYEIMLAKLEGIGLEDLQQGGSPCYLC